MADVAGSPQVARVTYAQTYIEWPPIIAGAVLAGALSFVLFTFATAIGLALISPYPAHSHGRTAASIAALFALAVPIGSLLIGGYIAGRMRAPRELADEAETEFRDGLHGALVWGLSILVGGFLAFMAATAAAQSGPTRTAASPSFDSVAADTLVTPVAVAETGATPPAAVPPATPTARAANASSAPTAQVLTADEHAIAARVIASAVAAGSLAPQQKAYLARLVEQRTGMSAADADRRVEQTFLEARQAADEVRRATVVGAFVTAAGLMLGLAAAWYAAQRGGHHRDQNVPARFTWAYRPRPRQTGMLATPSERR
jgi:MFS family permease